MGSVDLRREILEKKMSERREAIACNREVL